MDIGAIFSHVTVNPLVTIAVLAATTVTDAVYVFSLRRSRRATASGPRTGAPFGICSQPFR
jgi:hypothetical protein